MAHAKQKMFIRHQGRDILLVAGNLGLELREVWWKLRDNGCWSWNMELVVESVSMNKSSWKVQRMKTKEDEQWDLRKHQH